jgi:flavin-dependent dehydrogenase
MGPAEPPPESSVVVVGGGTAGATTALALQRLGVQTTIVRRAAPPCWKVGEGLPPAANPFLRRLGVWDRFRADRHLPSFGNASSWGSADLVDYSFVFDPHGAGWHLDRPRFDAMLLQAAREHGAQVITGTAAVDGRSVAAGDFWIRVTPEDGEAIVLRPPFVVDASGRVATIARLGNRREHNDRLVAVVGVFATQDPAGDPDSRTIVEAVEDGWWYSAAIPDGRLVVAFMSDGDLVGALGAYRLDGWSGLLGKTVHTCDRVVRLGCQPLTLPLVVLANSSRLLEVAGPTWVAVGDAAIAHDPLSSQGIASALLLGLSAADAIAGQLSGRADATEAYRMLVARLHDEYIRGLAYYYGREARWPRSPFWARRSGGRDSAHLARQAP